MTQVVTEGIGFFKEGSLEEYPEDDVFEVSATLSTVTAFEKLVEKGYHSAPVKEGRKYIGFLDTADFVSYVVKTLHRSSAPDVEPPFEASMKELLVWMNMHIPDSADFTSNLASNNPFRCVPANASMLDVLTMLSEKRVKRVTVIDPVSHKVVKIVTQSSITKLLLKDHEEVLDLLGNATVATTNMGFIDDVKSVSICAAAINAFEAMDKFSISAVPIIDRKQDNKLVGVLSDTDLRIIAKKNLRVYGMDVLALLKSVKPENPNAVFSVKAATKIVDIFHVMNDNHIHRVYITNAKEQPIGVITFKELLGFLVSKAMKKYIH
eukprot:m.80946 g.80946  ORF g.80946 m.80946 type:complete len:322 (+) comp8638_c2_seq4:85-1050(+)